MLQLRLPLFCLLHGGLRSATPLPSQPLYYLLNFCNIVTKGYKIKNINKLECYKKRYKMLQSYNVTK